MGGEAAHFIGVLISEEIARRVEASAKSQQIIPAARWSREIAQMYRGSEFSEDEIATRILIEATKADVLVQVGSGSTQSLDSRGPFGRP